jgi:hypothetical protein
MRESKVEAYFKRQVELTGGFTRKAQWIGRYGCPDRWCGWPKGKAGWVELKGSRGKLSVHQVHEHSVLRLCGERVDVLASLEEVDAYIKEMTT